MVDAGCLLACRTFLTALILAAFALVSGGPAAYAQYASEGLFDEDAAARAAYRDLERSTSAFPVPLPVRRPRAGPSKRTPAPVEAANGESPEPPSKKPAATPEKPGPGTATLPSQVDTTAALPPRSDDTTETAETVPTLVHETGPEKANINATNTVATKAPAQAVAPAAVTQQRHGASPASHLQAPASRVVTPPVRKPVKSARQTERSPAQDTRKVGKKPPAPPPRGQPKTRQQQCAALTKCRRAFAKCRFSKDRAKTDEEGWEVHKRECGAQYEKCIDAHFAPGEMFFTRWFLPYDPCS